MIKVRTHSWRLLGLLVVEISAEKKNHFYGSQSPGQQRTSKCPQDGFVPLNIRGRRSRISSDFFGRPKT